MPTAAINEPETSDEQDMICVCKLDGLIAAERRCVQALSMLGISDPSRLTETLIMSLAFEFSAEVWVFVDQWFGIEAEAPGYEASVIEADHPLDGLIEVWFRLAKRFPEKLRRLASDVSAVLEWSQRQIDRVGQAYAELSTHDAVCEICRRRLTDPLVEPTRCPKGLVLWLTGIGEQRAIRDKWGIPRESRSPRLWGDR